MLSFTLTNNSSAVQIHCDDAGRELLMKALSMRLPATGGHLHLWSPNAGGNELADLSPFGEDAISEVIISYQPAPAGQSNAR